MALSYNFFIGNKVGAAEIPNNTNMLEFKGMNLVAPVKEVRENTFLELKNSHVNAISIMPYAFVNKEKAGVSFNNDQQWAGEKTEGVIASIQQSHNANFKVMLKPHLWINHGTYTGHLDFGTDKEWIIWENDYEKYLLHFAEIAQNQNVELLCIGTELGNSIAKRPQYWTKLIQNIKKIYSGKLTYAANWDDFDEVPFWNEMDYIGIDAYFPLSKSETPSIEEMKLGWEKHLFKIEETQKKTGKNILFTEFGYRNSNYCADEPWTEANSTENNLGQANAFEALFQSISEKPWYKGGFAWKWYADDYHKKRKMIDYTPQEKPALKVIEKWYN
ncbi:MAG: hypothetical protein RQ864_00860 [Lutibacter sp.]|nr:hypothetical protein [Lutibacter sp.]